MVLTSHPIKNQFLVGLTGGIASGKTFVAEYFAELGAAIVDTDVIAREVVQPGAPALDEIRELFGPSVIDGDGKLDRKALRGVVFADATKRRQLEGILHPKIREETFRQAAAADGPYVIVVVPLLFESPIKDEMDRILVVDCSEETQIARLVARDNESEEQGRRIMATQASRKDRLSIADDVINNDGDRKGTKGAVRRLHQTYLKLADRDC